MRGADFSIESATRVCHTEVCNQHSLGVERWLNVSELSVDTIPVFGHSPCQDMHFSPFVKLSHFILLRRIQETSSRTL